MTNTVARTQVAFTRVCLTFITNEKVRFTTIAVMLVGSGRTDPTILARLVIAASCLVAVPPFPAGLTYARCRVIRADSSRSGMFSCAYGALSSAYLCFPRALGTCCALAWISCLTCCARSKSTGGSSVASFATAGSFAGLINFACLTDTAVGAFEGLARVNFTVNPRKTYLACARGGSTSSGTVSAVLARVLVTASGLITIGAFPAGRTRAR